VTHRARKLEKWKHEIGDFPPAGPPYRFYDSATNDSAKIPAVMDDGNKGTN
jgi:hypothetical protein